MQRKKAQGLKPRAFRVYVLSSQRATGAVREHRSVSASPRHRWFPLGLEPARSAYAPLCMPKYTTKNRPVKSPLSGRRIRPSPGYTIVHHMLLRRRPKDKSSAGREHAAWTHIPPVGGRRQEPTIKGVCACARDLPKTHSLGHTANCGNSADCRHSQGRNSVSVR
jgi:hypothetical protein